MKFAQRLFMGIGGLAAVAALLTVVSPKAHALAATLVEVVNTRSTPVPNQDVDHPGRHPYQLSCNATGTDQNGYISCQMPATPPNTELVIQNASVAVLYTVPVYPAELITKVGGVTTWNYLLLAPQSSSAFVASQLVTQYNDPGTQPAVFFQATSPNPNVVLECTITGYTVTLP